MTHEQMIEKAYLLREKREQQPLSSEEETELSRCMSILAPAIQSDIRTILNMNEKRMDKKFERAIKRLKNE